MSLVDLSLAALLGAMAAGLASAGLTAVVRVLPGVAGLLLAGKKPWACDTCMGFWSSLATVGALHGLTMDPWAWAALPGSVAVAVFLNGRIHPPAQAMPELVDMEEQRSSSEDSGSMATPGSKETHLQEALWWDDWVSKDMDVRGEYA
jgi:hypothetical protein